MKSAYEQKLQDPRWRDRRAALLLLRGTACEDCGQNDGKVEVHHGYYTPGREPWDYPDTALHVLCGTCHGGRHGLAVARGMADGFDLKNHLPPPDPRKKLWEIAQHEAGTVAAQSIMEAICWLWFKKGVHDWRVIGLAAKAMGKARSRYALAQPGGPAFENWIGDTARDRASEERAENLKADAEAGLTRRG